MSIKMLLSLHLKQLFCWNDFNQCSVFQKHHHLYKLKFLVVFSIPSATRTQTNFLIFINSQFHGKEPFLQHIIQKISLNHLRDIFIIIILTLPLSLQVKQKYYSMLKCNTNVYIKLSISARVNIEYLRFTHTHMKITLQAYLCILVN